MIKKTGKVIGFDNPNSIVVMLDQDHEFHHGDEVEIIIPVVDQE